MLPSPFENPGPPSASKSSSPFSPDILLLFLLARIRGLTYAIIKNNFVFGGQISRTIIFCRSRGSCKNGIEKNLGNRDNSFRYKFLMRFRLGWDFPTCTSNLVYIFAGGFSGHKSLNCCTALFTKPSAVGTSSRYVGESTKISNLQIE